MKTYDERMEAILKKAKIRKAVRCALRAAAAIFGVAAVVCAVMLLPQPNWSHQVDTPVLNAPSGANPDTQLQIPTSSTTGDPMINLPVFTSPTSPGNTQGPPSDNDEPYANLKFEAFHIKTTQPSRCDSYPAIHLIRTVAELTDFCNDRYQEYIAFEDVTNHAQRYDESYFYDNSLIVLMLEEGSGSIRHNVVNVAMYANNVVNVELDRIVPEIGTCDEAYWYIIVEVDALLPEDSFVCYQMSDLPAGMDKPEKLVDLIPAWEQQKMCQVYIDQFTEPSEHYTKEEVWQLRVVAVLDRRYALFVDDNIFSYLDWITGETVDGVEFKYGSSQHMYLYYDGYYYRLQEAFDAGLISHEDLLQIQENYNNGYGAFFFG